MARDFATEGESALYFYKGFGASLQIALFVNCLLHQQDGDDVSFHWDYLSFFVFGLKNVFV